MYLLAHGQAQTTKVKIMQYPNKVSNIARESGLSDFEAGTMAVAAALASNDSQAKWEPVYCSESENKWNKWTETRAEQASSEAVVTTTVNLPDNGGYVLIEVGVGWFAWGVGDPLCSAIMEYFAEV